MRLMAKANAERMTSEAELLNKSPLLINKIVAERLSDKIQVVMVPSDGKFFFANDVFKSMAQRPGGEAGDGQPGRACAAQRALRFRNQTNKLGAPGPVFGTGEAPATAGLETGAPFRRSADHAAGLPATGETDFRQSQTI